jgi:5-methylcytosine-specific restriction endonuclease McrA
MNLSSLSNESLLSQTKLFAQKEREMTLQVLHHLKEVERRRLFASLGFSSLFDYVTKELGYCAASACRRIDAMRLLKEMPELEPKIQEGALTLSAVARAQSFFKKEPLPAPTKKALMKKLENKSIREIEKELLSLTTTPENHLQEKIKPVTPHLSEVKFYAEDELLKDLEKLKGLLAHSHPNMTTAELIYYLAKLGLKKLDPAQNETKPKEAVQSLSIHTTNTLPKKTITQITPAPNNTSRYIPRLLVRAVWKRDESRCTWIDPKTGRSCNSTYRLQIDHCHPFALGGETTLDNLRLLYAQHNLYESERWFGLRFRKTPDPT